MTDSLPSWNDTPTKQAILDFVATVTDEASPDYVPPPERIATFDNENMPTIAISSSVRCGRD